MFIRRIELADFRNYEGLNIELHPNTNILYGDNAQGKTNLLEAIYLCSTTRSHRGVKDRDLIRFGCNEAHLKMLLSKNDSNYRIDMHLKKSRNKGIAVNSVPIKSSAELIGITNIVFFAPEDLLIIKNGPVERRRFLNMELSQIDRVYLGNLMNYNKVLAERNNIVRELGEKGHSGFEGMLEVYEEQLQTYGERIIRIRESFVEELNGIIEKIHEDLTEGKEELHVSYEKSLEAERIAEDLFMNRERDIRNRTTSAGPHRDDLCFQLTAKGGRTIDVRRFGSQGQQRSTAISLKLSEIEQVKRRTGESPILLLDDVMSELDRGRQKQLLEGIGGIQTIITCTGLDHFLTEDFKVDRIFSVENGTIRQIQQGKIGG